MDTVIHGTTLAETIYRERGRVRAPVALCSAAPQGESLSRARVSELSSILLSQECETTY